MSQAPAPVRVKSGPPWWVWIILTLATVAVVGGVIVSSVPENPNNLYLEAKSILDDPRSNKTQVEHLLTRLRTKDGFEPHVTLLEGMLAYNEVRDLRALELFAKIPDGHDLKPFALQKSGDAYRRSGDFEKSMKAYQQAIDLDSEISTDARVALSQMYTGVGAFALAEQVLTEAIEQDPDSKVAIEARAGSRHQQAHYAEALEDYKQVLKTPGDFSATSPAALSRYAECLLKTDNKELLQPFVDDYLELLESHDQKMALRLALDQIEETRTAVAAASAPSAAGGPAEVPRILAASFELAVKEKDWKEAKQVADVLMLRSPRDKRLYELALELYRNTDQPERAQYAEQNIAALTEMEAELQQNLERVGDDIDDAEGRLEVARRYLQLGRYDSARIWFSLAATMDSSYRPEAQDAILGKTFPREPIVPFESKAADEAATEEKPVEKQPASEEPADEAAKKDPADKTESAKEAPATKASADEKPSDDDQPSKTGAANEETSDDAKPADAKPAPKDASDSPAADPVQEKAGSAKSPADSNE